MKKFLCLILAIACVLSVAACGKKDDSTLNFAMPDGAPTLAAFSMMDSEAKLGAHPIEYEILSGAANIATTFTSGSCDIAIMPTNVAAKLYNQGVKIKLLSVNVYGVLYMVGQTPIENYTDLYGKVVYNIGAGGTPDLALKCIFDKLDVEYVESETPVDGKVALSYVTEASAAVVKVKQNANAYGVMGEPVATQCCAAANAVVVMNIQEEWKNLNDTEFPQAGVVVSEKIYSDKNLTEKLFSKLAENPAYIVANAQKVQETITKAGSALEAQFNEALLTRCNLKCVKASAAKADLEAYYTAIKGYDATFIGGDLPDDGFYL